MRAILDRFARDWRLALLAAGFIAALASLAAPKMTAQRDTRDLLIIVDVTGSMNVRDTPAGSRLAAAKLAARDLLAALPCQSRLGLGIFTERRAFLLFEPAEVCENFAAIDGAIEDLDWRMAWEGDSYVARGLHAAISLAKGLGADIVFLTDGHEAPPLAGGSLPPFDGEPGAVAGLLVGVGASQLVPIPKFNEDGRETGFFEEADVPQENRTGPPPEDAASRAGWNPRNAPWGGDAATGSEHLSSMKTDHLRALAAQTGLTFTPLTSADALLRDVGDNTRALPVEVSVDTAPVPAAVALALIGLLFSATLLTSRRAAHLPAS